MIRRPPRSTLDRSSAASDVYKRQAHTAVPRSGHQPDGHVATAVAVVGRSPGPPTSRAVSYTHLRAHETVLDLVCRLLLEKTKTTPTVTNSPLLPYPEADTRITEETLAIYTPVITCT